MVDRSSTIRVVWPAVVAMLASLAFAGFRLAERGWDPAGLGEPGTRYSELDPDGSEGYDGQFTYTMAVEPDPGLAAPHLDRPAYRYQRILLPWLARVMTLGEQQAVPWALLLIGVVASGAGTAALAAWLQGHGHWEGYALGYGLWVGVVASAGLFLHEALAYGLAALGWLGWRRSGGPWAALALSLALFAKETTITFWAAALAPAVWRQRVWLIAGGLGFALWQGVLWATFGEVGIGSGGALSTPFEFVPLMGFARIGTVSPAVLGLFLVIFGPTIIVPALWASAASLRRLAAFRPDPEAWALLLNAAVIVFVPFSTAREPLGLVRLATGLVLAALLFAAAHGLRRVLNYSLFWISLLALLLRR